MTKRKAKIDFSMKMEDEENFYDGSSDGDGTDKESKSSSEPEPPPSRRPWPELEYPLPNKGDLPPKDYYILVFMCLPLVRDLRAFRDEFVDEIKRSLPAKFATKNTILWEHVYLDERDEYQVKLERSKHDAVRDTSGNENILMHTNMFVPMLNPKVGRALMRKWNGKVYYGRPLAVEWSDRYGRQDGK